MTASRSWISDSAARGAFAVVFKLGAGTQQLVTQRFALFLQRGVRLGRRFGRVVRRGFGFRRDLSRCSAIFRFRALAQAAFEFGFLGFFFAHFHITFG